MTNIPRVAIIISHPIQHFCPQYVSYAAQKDWKTKVFFASALGAQSYVDKDFKQDIVWNNLRLEAFDHVFLNGGVAVPVNLNLDAPALEKELKEYNPDVIIVSGYSQKFQRRAFQWARKNDKVIFYSADSERHHKRAWWKEQIKYPFLLTYFKKIDRFLTVGNSNEHYYQYYNVPLRKMTRVGFSIDVIQYRNALKEYAALRAVVRERMNIPDNAVVLSVVGKLIFRKRQADLISALLTLESESKLEYHLLIIGSGPLQEELVQQAKRLSRNRVHFTDFVIPEQLPGFYAATDIYVHPSEMEPHSLAVSEAIFMKCPIIISNRCGSYGPTDDVQEGQNGFVYTCGDISALKNCIRRLAENKDLRQAFSNFSSSFAEVSQGRAHGEGLRAALRAEQLL